MQTEGIDHPRPFFPDEPWRQDVIAHYGNNLHRIVQLTRQAGVPLLLVNPVSNLRDCPPFKSEHRQGLSAEDLQRWEQLWAQAEAAYATDLRQAVALLEQAAAIDDQHAGVHYELGMCLLTLGRRAEARAALIKAKELDVCPLRMLEPMKQTIADVAAETGTPLVDADALIAKNSHSGFPDLQWMIDHVHPTIDGHQVIADDIAAKGGCAVQGGGWQQARQRHWQDDAVRLQCGSIGGQQIFHSLCG